MADDASAYATLGLEPDATDAAIENAYRRLIKQYHPDREGGDSGRAAEINHAYRELRANRNLKDALEFHRMGDTNAKKSPALWFAYLVIASAVGITLLAVAGWVQSRGVRIPGVMSANRPSVAVRRDRADPMEQPLFIDAIHAAAHQAQTLVRTRDEMALASNARDCHHALRLEPTMTQFDRCAAFDDAVIQLQNRDPLRDQGPFAELAVTGRLWSAATAISDDSVAIDGRLSRIRQEVEQALVGAPSN